MTQTQEQLEFAISQYVDGTLSPIETVALEARLRDDANSRALLADYRALQAAITDALPLPSIDFAALSSRISADVAAVGMDERPAAAPLRMPFVGRLRYLAAAAAIVLVAGVTILWPTSTHDARPGPPGDVAVNVAVGPKINVSAPGTALVAVIGPASIDRSSAPVAKISVGPTADYVAATASDSWMSRSPTLIIANAQGAAQDSASMPY